MTQLDLNRFRDVLGQLPRLKTYTHVLLAFPLSDGNSSTNIVASLEAATTRLLNAFPWLACRVVQEDGREGKSGAFRLAECREFAPPNIALRTEDCSQTCPTYEKILSSRGAVGMLDGDLLAPVPAFPQIYDDASLNPAPVFTLKVNLIQGGILLDAAAQHNFIDGGGLLRLLELLAKSMRGEDFSPEELWHGNRDRSDIISLLGPNEPMLDHSHLMREPLGKPNGTSTPQSGKSDLCWRFVRFPASKVAALKDHANEDLRHGDGIFVSTNDALSAFIWKSITVVRLKHRRRPDEVSKFSRALDARRALGIPREYLGQMGYNATCRLTFHELQSQSLGETALYMRRAVGDVNNEYSVRSWATFVEQTPDKSRIMFGGSFNPDTDIGLSSLIHGSVSDVQFGILGRPDLVRRPNFLPLQSCVYLWTRTAAGHVDILLCLKEDEFKGLRANSQWKDCTEFIE